jgi:hypothetical protein
MEEEMRFHLEMQIEQNLAAGMAAEEARYAARRQFGNQAWLKEVSREMMRLEASNCRMKGEINEFEGWRPPRHPAIMTLFGVLLLTATPDAAIRDGACPKGKWRWKICNHLILCMGRPITTHSSEGGFLLVCVPSRDLIGRGIDGSPLKSGILRRRSMRARIRNQEPRTSSLFRYAPLNDVKWLCATLRPGPELTL